MLFLLTVLALGQTTETTLEFAKIDAVATNPSPPHERLVYTKACAIKMVQNFKEVPVYVVYIKDKKEEFVQIGTVNCIYTNDKWLNATLKIKKEIPKDYVLRAKVVATEVDPNRYDIITIKNATITEFYLKPKNKASVFE